HQVGGKRGVRETFESDETRKISLGRNPDGDLVFGARETKVSAQHAEIHQEGNGFRILDLRSTNGTYVNGGKVTSSELHDGDLIELGLGGPRIKFELAEIAESSADVEEDNVAREPVITSTKEP